jgi:hypothetical protein
VSALSGAIWLYPWDLLDEGPEVVLRRVRDEGGMKAVHLAVCYHAGLFLLPHNPRRKVYFPLDGSVYYRPHETTHAGRRLQPLVHPMVHEADPLRVAQETAARLGMGVAAWVVLVHNTRLGMEYPDCVQINAFGDPHYPSLCPAHPEVRAYAIGVVSDVARYHPQAIVIESLEYMPVEHGYHHEVMGIALTPTASILLGLCFCNHCLRRAANAGVDGEGVRRATAEVLEAFFAGHGPATAPALDPQSMYDMAGGQMAGYTRVREGVVTSLYGEVASQVRCSWTGTLARADFAPLRSGELIGHILRSGAHPTTLSAYVDRQDPTLYAPDPDEIESRYHAYRLLVPQDAALMPVLRVIRPQTESKAVLVEAVRRLRAAGVTQVSFYNYGFMRLETLGWIREALESS